MVINIKEQSAAFRGAFKKGFWGTHTKLFISVNGKLKITLFITQKNKSLEVIQRPQGGCEQGKKNEKKIGEK